MTTKPGRWMNLVAFAAAVGSATPSLAATTLVFYCGQSFRGRGVLIANLDCAGFGGPGVTVERGRLYLQGHQITGAGQYGVHCIGNCLIKGPGRIFGNGLDGIRSEGSVTLRGVNVTYNTLDGVNARNFSASSRVNVVESTIANNGYNGIASDSWVVLRRSLVKDNGEHGVDVGVPSCDTTGRILLVGSIVSGHSGTCTESPVCADLTSCGRANPRPRLRASSRCNTSSVRGSPPATWGVCLQD